MGLGRLFTRSTRYTASDTVTGATSTFTVIDNLAPDWPSAGYQGAMGIPGAWRAATMLSDLLGLVPWDAWRCPADQPEVKIQPTPPLLEQPNPPDTRMTSFSSLGLDLIWHGNGIGVVAARNTLGWPTAAVLVPATEVGVRRVTKWIDSPLPVGALEYSIGEMRLGSQDVIHIKGPCEPGAVRGMGVLETQLNTLSLAQEQARQARSVATHGVPTGILESSNPDLTDDEARDLKDTWMRNQQQRTVAVLNPSTKFTPLSWNPEESQLVEARKMTLNELELVFGLPVGWLGGTNSSRVYSNIEMDAVNLLKFSLGGHLARFEQTLSLAFPRGTYARANMDAVLRADTLTRYQAHQIGITAGFLTVDEAREYEHRPPLPEKPVQAPPPALPAVRVDGLFRYNSHHGTNGKFSAGGGGGGGGNGSSPAGGGDAGSGPLGRMTTDAFFAAHGGNNAWHDQYGGGQKGASAILWKDGTANLYHPTGKGDTHVVVVSGLDARSAHHLGDTVDWAAKKPADKPPHLADGPQVETRTVKLPDGAQARVGYGYEPNGDGSGSSLVVTTTFTGGGLGGRSKTFTLDEGLDEAASGFADDMRQLAGDMGKMQARSRFQVIR